MQGSKPVPMDGACSPKLVCPAMQFRVILFSLLATLPTALVVAGDYQSLVSQAKPLAWWRFDDLDEGRARDAQPLGLHGRYSSGAVNRRGVGGLGVTFGTAAARVEVQLTDEQNQKIESAFNGSFTLEFWLRDDASAPDGSTNYSLFYKADRKAFTANSIWMYRARQDGHYHFRIDGGEDRRIALTIRNPAGARSAGDQLWHHIVVAVDRTARPHVALGFVDGKAVAQANIPIADISNNGPLLIGNNHHQNSPWQGGIDELAVYARALSVESVMRHYQAGLKMLKSLASRPVSIDSKRDFFELTIRPLLVEKCASCHSGEPDAESSLSVVSRRALLGGGDFGPAIVPGHADDSLLIHAVKRIHKELRMPPDDVDALSRSEVSALERWINQGAIWPNDDTVSPARPDVVGASSSELAESSHWSLLPRDVVEPPDVDGPRWGENAIDSFLEAKRRDVGLSASGRADRRTLIRRATFDLTGLPPTPAEVDAFVGDSGGDRIAFARVVDRLLASKHYGERQGRQWLDVARYADTQGDVGDIPIPTAYLYRNWVIDSFNSDMPFDSFLQAQIAGDILARDCSDRDKARSLVIATGFLALSRRFGNTKKDDINLTIEDTLDTIGRGVLGLTLRCARCHDHKFDPILQTDYYGLYGIFESTVYPWMGMSNEKSPSDLAPAVPGADSQRKANEYWALITRYEYQINNHFRPWLKPTLDEYRAVTRQLEASESSEKGELLKRLRSRREELLNRHSGRFRELMIHGLNWIKSEKKRLAENPGIEFVFGVSEGQAHDARLHRRGNRRTPGPIVPRRFPVVLTGPKSVEISLGSGRLELASWLTRPEHPLTARVIVNRIWKQHFGRGLVSTADNFGRQGEAPSHPGLLDWLADRFVRDGWSLKTLHRHIMQSSTYALDSHGRSSDHIKADPENVYLWRFARRRLDAEEIRDSMLAVSGRLDRTQGGPHPFKPWHAVRYSLNRPFHDEFPTNRRSVYLMTQRLFRDSFLGLFDGPDTNSSTSDRNSASIPSQALYLMNSPFVKQQAEALARRLANEADDEQQQITRLYRLTLGRVPEDDERELSTTFLSLYRDAAGAKNDDDGLAALCRTMLTSNEFFFVD